MSDRNRNDKDKNPLEIPENTPSGQPKPIRATKNDKTMKKMKYAYAFALLLALGTALITKISTEKALGNLAPIESDYVTITTEKVTTKDSAFLTTEPDFEVRQNLEDVPDTREETEAPTEKEINETKEETTQSNKYATPYQDYYSLPLGTDILKDYSPDKPTYSATMGDWRTHSGIDFKAAEGEQVKAISYGTVTNVYDDALWGTVVLIDHGNGVTAKYCGFNKDTLEVKKGAVVESGSLLGYLGTIPCEKSELSHLHFELSYNGENVEPLELMGK